MDSVLFVTWDGGGNVPPALGIAAELKRRGAAVRVLGHPSQRTANEAAGFTAEEFRHARPWSMLTARSGPRAPLAYAAVFTDRGMGEDLVESVRSVPTDRVVIDGLLMGAISGAARAGIPYSVLVHTLYGVMDKTLNRGPLGLIVRARGLNPAGLYRSADRILAVTLEDIDAGRQTDVDYTGPVFTENATRGIRESAVAPETTTGVPVVLVSLSTTYIQGQREALQRILDALTELPLRAVVTTGPSVEPADLRAPANAEVHQYVPHEQLMPTASLVIGHGGHATTMQALAHGLPLLVMPMNPIFDQPAIGRAITEHGAGLTLGKKATVAEIRSAVERLLEDAGGYRQGAKRLGARIRSRDGAAAAADLIASDAPARQAITS
jgi:UDP:flavonoid glycosyltransferase YjiC (YdhE family)